MGERRKTGGRKKGSKNKSTREKIAAIEASGETPLNYMLRVMRDKSVVDQRRDDMSKAAAPYVHSKLTAIEHSGPDGGPIQVTRIERVIVDPQHSDS